MKTKITYFALAGDAVKIGSTRSIETRMVSLQVSCRHASHRPADAHPQRKGRLTMDATLKAISETAAILATASAGMAKLDGEIRAGEISEREAAATWREIKALIRKAAE